MKEKHPLIERAIHVAGSQQRLAEAAGISQSSISRMLLKQERVSGDDAVAIETATGGQVLRHEIRPDLWPHPVVVQP